MKKFKLLMILLCCVVSVGMVFASCGEKTPDESGKELEKTKYTVTFNSDGGTAVASQQVEEGGKAVKPNDPIKNPTDTQEFTFIGWFVGDEKWEFTLDTITENITLVAKYSVNKSSIQYE